MAQHTDCSELWECALVMEVSKALQGKTFSVTGHVGIKRDDLVKIIETAGGHFEEQPRYGVNYLITNRAWNKGSTVEEKKSSKLIKAERLGIKIISESKFCKMVIDGGETAADNGSIDLI
jgi:NAD-dependent DNA ligase